MSVEICNFISIIDQYTTNLGKLNITTNKCDIYLNDKLTKKSDLILKFHQMILLKLLIILLIIIDILFILLILYMIHHHLIHL